MTTVIKIEGDPPYLIPHVDHIAAIAHGENVDLTMYVALPGHTDLEPVYVQLGVPAGIAPYSVELYEAVVAVNDVKRPSQFGQERDCWSPFRSERQARPAGQEVACRL